MNGLLKRFLTWALHDVIQDVIDSEENQIALGEVIENELGETRFQREREED